MIFDKAFSGTASLKTGTAPAADAPDPPSTADSSGSLDWGTFMDAFGLRGMRPDQMSEATYLACLRILSESLGKLPLRMTQSTEKLGTVTCRGHPLYRTLRYRPNPFETAASFWSGLELSRNHYGNAYAWIKTLNDGSIQLWRLPSTQVTIWWDNARILADNPHLWYRWSAPNGKGYVFSDDEILHFRTWLSWDGVSGLSIREMLKLTIDGSLSAQEMLNTLYKNGMTGKAVLKYTGDLNGDLEQTFVRNLQNYIDGKVDGSRSLIPLPIGTDLAPLDIKLADGQFVEIRKYTALQIAAAFGVKPDQINDYSKSSYSSSEAQQVAFLVDTLLWMLGHYEQEINYKLVSAEDIAAGYEGKFNPGVLMRTTTDKQVDSLTKGIAGGLYMPDEARGHMDMSKVPGGDRVYFANGSAIPVAQAGNQYGGKGGKENEP